MQILFCYELSEHIIFWQCQDIVVLILLVHMFRITHLQGTSEIVICVQLLQSSWLDGELYDLVNGELRGANSRLDFNETDGATMISLIVHYVL